jgi:hypothetical protein
MKYFLQGKMLFQTDDNGHLGGHAYPVQDEETIEKVRLMCDGGMSKEQIVDELNKDLSY